LGTEQGIYQTLQGAGLADKFKLLTQASQQVSQIENEAFQRYLHVSGESEARDAPFLKRNPSKAGPGQLPLNVNPELQPGRQIEMGPVFKKGGAVAKADGGPLSFDDLVPQGAAPSGGGGMFDDLVPQGPSVGGDIAKSAGSGLARGLIGGAGFAGDAANALAKGSKVASDFITDQFGLDKGPEPAPPVLPTSGGIQKAVESKTGAFYEPKTTYGKFAGAAGETLGNPLSYIGAGGALGKVAGAAATGLGSEAAGQAAQQYAPDWEGTARVAGGLLGGSAAGELSATAQNVMRGRGIPTTDSLRAAADNAYGQARALNVEYTPSNLVILRDQIQRDLLKRGFRADKSDGTFNRIKELPDPPTPANPGGARNFSDIEGVRQSLREITGEVDTRGMRTADAKAASHAIDHIDDFLEDPSKAAAGQQGLAQQQAQFAAEGRGNWAAMARSQQIEQALAKSDRNAAATGSGANVDNALRQQVKNILNSPNRAKNFTADDRSIMEDIVAGNPVRNSARLLGKIAITGAVSAASAEYLAHTMGLGPLGHAALPAIGYAAKKAADIGTRNRYNSLLEHIRMDSPVGRANPVGPRASAVPSAVRAAATTPSGRLYVSPSSTNPYAPP
jgi:hypothetical protein